MINECGQRIKVLSSMLDLNMEMGVVQMLNVVQDNMCEYFGKIKCDGGHLISEYNCFFVLTKTKIKINRSPRWLEEFDVKTITLNVSRVAVTLLTTFADVVTGEVFVKCEQELCVMDNTSRKLRMINTTSFPLDMEVVGVDGKIFSKINIDVTDEDLCASFDINAMNIDMYHHVNNVEYVRLALSTLEKEYLVNNRINELEIHYNSECKYGERLSVFKRLSGDEMYFENKTADRVCVRLRMKCVGVE